MSTPRPTAIKIAARIPRVLAFRILDPSLLGVGSDETERVLGSPWRVSAPQRPPFLFALLLTRLDPYATGGWVLEVEGDRVALGAVAAVEGDEVVLRAPVEVL